MGVSTTEYNELYGFYPRGKAAARSGGISFDMPGFIASLDASKAKIRAATRPAAQAATQVVWEYAVLNAPEGEKEHMFYGSAAKKAAKGSKKALAYGPFVPGTLKRAIYQAFAEKKSGPYLATYRISFNREKAPYGHMVELGTSRAAAHPFLLPALHDHADLAFQVMKREFIDRVTA